MHFIVHIRKLDYHGTSRCVLSDLLFNLRMVVPTNFYSPCIHIIEATRLRYTAKRKFRLKSGYATGLPDKSNFLFRSNLSLDSIQYTVSWVVMSCCYVGNAFGIRISLLTPKGLTPTPCHPSLTIRSIGTDRSHRMSNLSQMPFFYTICQQEFVAPYILRTE